VAREKRAAFRDEDYRGGLLATIASRLKR